MAVGSPTIRHGFMKKSMTMPLLSVKGVEDRGGLWSRDVEEWKEKELGRGKSLSREANVKLERFMLMVAVMESLVWWMIHMIV